MERIILKARDGYIYTDGTNYGKIIYLAINADPAIYHEITKEEYNLILQQQEQENTLEE